MEKCRATIERINRGGYDSGGHYWGNPDRPLFRVEDDATGDVFFYRASCRDDAKAQHTAAHPGSAFYR